MIRVPDRGEKGELGTGAFDERVTHWATQLSFCGIVQRALLGCVEMFHFCFKHLLQVLRFGHVGVIRPLLDFVGLWLFCASAQLLLNDQLRQFGNPRVRVRGCVLQQT